MRFKNTIICFFLTFILVSWTGDDRRLVTSVIDGDTILVSTGERIRYLGIDAPEIDHEHGHNQYLALESKNYNIGCVHRKWIRLESDVEKSDSHGRLLAYVFLENGRMVNELLVSEGLAHMMVSGPELRYFRLLLNAQRSAMKRRAGIWANTATGRAEPFYLGNKRSYRFHRPGCPFAKMTSPSNRITFPNREDALWEGYSPCRRCSP